MISLEKTRTGRLGSLLARFRRKPVIPAPVVTRPQPEKKPSFLRRIFGRKPKEIPPQPTPTPSPPPPPPEVKPKRIIKWIVRKPKPVIAKAYQPLPPKEPTAKKATFTESRYQTYQSFTDYRSRYEYLIIAKFPFGNRTLVAFSPTLINMDGKDSDNRQALQDYLIDKYDDYDFIFATFELALTIDQIGLPENRQTRWRD